jgi:hypothetical protein
MLWSVVNMVMNSGAVEGGIFDYMWNYQFIKDDSASWS